jgi:hypothetical protein
MQKEFMDSIKSLIARPLLLILVIFVFAIAIQLLISGKSKALEAALNALKDIVTLLKEGGWELIIVILLMGIFWGKNK